MNTKKNELFRLSIIAVSLLMIMLLLSHYAAGSSTVVMFLTTAIILFQLLAPFEILKRLQLRPRDCHIYAHNIDAVLDMLIPPFGKARPDFVGIKKELWHLSKVLIVIFPLYCLGYVAYFYGSTTSTGRSLALSFNVPPKIIYELINQIFVVALPEEIFYRGFLQTALLSQWPAPRRKHYQPFGIAFVATNLIFALGHVASTLSPIRLLTFFPGMIFSYLVYKNHSLLGAILFHALCNILGQILYASVYLN